MDAASIICKRIAEFGVVPNFVDYESERRRFDWQAVGSRLAGLPGDGVNIAFEAVDRLRCGHVARQDRVPFPGARQAAARCQLRRTFQSEQPFCPCTEKLGRRQGRAGVRAGRPHSRTLRRGARQPQERQRGFAAVLGLRSGADRHARQSRRGHGAGHHRRALRAQGGEVARQDADARTCAARGRGWRAGRTCPARSISRR